MKTSSRARVKFVDGGVRVVEQTWMVPPWAYAWTIGHTILAKGHVTQELLDHELVHVVQYEKHGWGFIPLYFWASIVTLSYRNNRFEVEARETAAARQRPQEDESTAASE